MPPRETTAVCSKKIEWGKAGWFNLNNYKNSSFLPFYKTIVSLMIPPLSLIFGTILKFVRFKNAPSRRIILCGGFHQIQVLFTGKKQTMTLNESFLKMFIYKNLISVHYGMVVGSLPRGLSQTPKRGRIGTVRNALTETKTQFRGELLTALPRSFF